MFKNRHMRVYYIRPSNYLLTYICVTLLSPRSRHGQQQQTLLPARSFIERPYTIRLLVYTRADLQI